MKSPAQLLFLGTGASMGIPVIGCSCDVCKSNSSYNKRLRPSVLIMTDNQKILIDTTPDFRYQALHYHIDTLDGVIITHGHYDHTAGLDELRVYYMRSKKPLPCLLSKETADDLKIRFPYILTSKPAKDRLISRFELQQLKAERGVSTFNGLRIGYMSFEQMKMAVNGFRFGNLAYVSDIKEYPETIFEDLEGVEILVLSALRLEPSRLHFSVDEAVEFSKRVGAQMTWLTHVAHEVEHEKTNASLPDNVQLAYDGLLIDFEIEKENDC